MFNVILFMIAGLLSGFVLRSTKIGFVNAVIVTLIWCLLFLLGYEVGSNNDIIRHFHQLGFNAFLIALAATTGSALAARTIQKPLKESNKNSGSKIGLIHFQNIKGSIIILAFFIAGLVAGIAQIIPQGFYSPGVSFYVLCGLMFSVGFSLGHQPDTVKQFRSIPRKVLLLPFATIAGTWLGVLIAGLFMPYRLTDSLAIGSGFGYYSLSGILITQYSGAALGTVALLSNIFREIFTLILAPQLVRYFGKLAPIAAGGATTMDTTFPIILQTSGKEYSIVAIYSGFIVDFSVPFLVTFWLAM